MTTESETDPCTPSRGELERALEPFALMSSEGVITQETGHVTVTTCAEYFHRAAALRASPPAPCGELDRIRAALEPFAWIGQWLFARDLPDDTSMVTVKGVHKDLELTRGMFKAAHIALAEVERLRSLSPVSGAGVGEALTQDAITITSNGGGDAKPRDYTLGLHFHGEDAGDRCWTLHAILAALTSVGGKEGGLQENSGANQ